MKSAAAMLATLAVLPAALGAPQPLQKGVALDARQSNSIYWWWYANPHGGIDSGYADPDKSRDPQHRIPAVLKGDPKGQYFQATLHKPDMLLHFDYHKRTDWEWEVFSPGGGESMGKCEYQENESWGVDWWWCYTWK